VGREKSYSIGQKLEIITKLENGVPQSLLSRELAIPRSTVQQIWSCREKIITESSSVSLNFKNVKKSEFEEIDDQLLSWFNQQRFRNIPGNGPLLIEKSLEIATALGKTTVVKTTDNSLNEFFLLLFLAVLSFLIFETLCFVVIYNKSGNGRIEISTEKILAFCYFYLFRHLVVTH